MANERRPTPERILAEGVNNIFKKQRETNRRTIANFAQIAAELDALEAAHNQESAAQNHPITAGGEYRRH